jgi:protein SCO1/2
MAACAAPPGLTAQVSGQTIFQQKCAACHSAGSDRLIGPGLEGVMGRRDRGWVKRFIMQPDQLLNSDDPIAAALLQEYQIPMPNLAIPDGEAEALIAFLEGGSGAGPTAAPPDSPTGGRRATRATR